MDYTFKCFCHIALSSPTLDLRSLSARWLSASRSLEAASSSWRLATLFSGMSSRSRLRSWRSDEVSVSTTAGLRKHHSSVVVVVVVVVVVLA